MYSPYYETDEQVQKRVALRDAKHEEIMKQKAQEAQLSNISPNTQYAGVVAHEG